MVRDAARTGGGGVRVYWWESYPPQMGEDMGGTFRREGQVISSHGGLFGRSKFVVALDDGRIVTTNADECRLVLPKVVP